MSSFLTVAQPRLVELVADIAVEEVLARHLVALGQAQHLAAQRGQAPVEGVELVDQIFDLGAVELDALDLGGQLLAQLLILALVGRGQLAARAPSRRGAGCWILLELLVERGDAGELLERLRLELLFHLREAEGVVLLLVVRRARRAALGQSSSSSSSAGASSASSSSLNEGPAVFSLISPRRRPRHPRPVLRARGPSTASRRDRGSRAAASCLR